MVKAIILAAGMGTRLSKYTKDLPKGMLDFMGKPLVKWQVDVYKKMGVDDVIVIRGFAADKINFSGVRYYENKDFANTNMVETLFCAEKELEGEVLVSYADVLFEPKVLKKVLDSNADIGVTVDLAWKDYWTARLGSFELDTESLGFDDSGAITGLGTDSPPIEEIDGRYVGLLKFSKKGVEQARKVYHAGRKGFLGKPWGPSGKVFQKAYMTDLLNKCIEAGNRVEAIRIERGWLEFDTNGDYEKMMQLEKAGGLKRFFDLNALK
ncbi:MAG: phosphocholine cytidylyltransferase family protein [Candidatus Diapherotrites archaeon]|nr:phosphocholine cytidylyltransferase family protein [Candidatus Diapherotrites archaeon]